MNAEPGRSNIHENRGKGLIIIAISFSGQTIAHRAPFAREPAAESNKALAGMEKSGKILLLCF
jgi:hypothetical protein